MKLKHRIAIFSGGTHRIGKSIVEELAKVQVLFTCLHNDSLPYIFKIFKIKQDVRGILFNKNNYAILAV